MNTEHLIERLAKDLTPVEPLRRPGRRAAVWLLGAALYIAILTVAMSALGFATHAGDARLLLPQLAAIVAGVLAATAAFASVVPGYSKHVLVWPPIAAALVWLGTLIVGSLSQRQELVTILSAEHEWLCVAQIVIGSAPLVAVLAMMLRRGAPLNPALTAALAAIAVGILANVGACASTPHANDAITLVWHGGAILALVLVCAWGARFVLTWGAARRGVSA